MVHDLDSLNLIAYRIFFTSPVEAVSVRENPLCVISSSVVSIGRAMTDRL